MMDNGSAKISLLKRPPIPPTANLFNPSPTTEESSKDSASATSRSALESSDFEVDETTGLDGFLIAALKNPKDRLFLFKLDKELENFIADESRNRLEFPQMNSYQRLIIHRVAEYFKLSHVVDSTKWAVVLYKTEISEVPILRFADLVEEEESPAPAVKIIQRRSKGHSGREKKSGNSHKHSRPQRSLEEREAEYQKARARIFEDLEKNSASSADENNSNVVSSEGEKNVEAALNPTITVPLIHSESNDGICLEGGTTTTKNRLVPTPNQRWDEIPPGNGTFRPYQGFRPQVAYPPSQFSPSNLNPINPAYPNFSFPCQQGASYGPQFQPPHTSMDPINLCQGMNIMEPQYYNSFGPYYQQAPSTAATSSPMPNPTFLANTPNIHPNITYSNSLYDQNIHPNLPFDHSGVRYPQYPPSTLYPRQHLAPATFNVNSPMISLHQGRPIRNRKLFDPNSPSPPSSASSLDRDARKSGSASSDSSCRFQGQSTQVPQHLVPAENPQNIPIQNDVSSNLKLSFQNLQISGNRSTPYTNNRPFKKAGSGLLFDYTQQAYDGVKPTGETPKPHHILEVYDYDSILLQDPSSLCIPNATIRVVHSKQKMDKSEQSMNSEVTSQQASPIILALFKSTDLAREAMQQFEEGELRNNFTFNFKLRWWEPFRKGNLF